MVRFGACAKAEEADLDFGFWIVVVSVLYVEGLNAVVWILDFGFWILDLGNGLDFA